MNMHKNVLIEQFRSIALEEYEARFGRGDFWTGLTFSSARILSEVLHSPYSDHSKIIADALLRRSQSNIFGISGLLTDSDRALLVLLDSICGTYESAFKYLTISVKKPASRLALKNKWSLGTGLHYPGTQTGPNEIATAVFYHQEKIKTYNDQLVSLLRNMMHNKIASVPDEILRPLMTEDLFGSEEQWRKYATFNLLTGAQIRRTLHSTIGPYYDLQKRTGGFSFVRRHGSICVKLFVETGSSMAQFTYRYQMTQANDERNVVSVTFESILGLPGIGWDSIALADKEEFAAEFLRIDSIMRRIGD